MTVRKSPAGVRRPEDARTTGDALSPPLCLSVLPEGCSHHRRMLAPPEDARMRRRMLAPPEDARTTGVSLSPPLCLTCIRLPCQIAFQEAAAPAPACCFSVGPSSSLGLAPAIMADLPPLAPAILECSHVGTCAHLLLFCGA